MPKKIKKPKEKTGHNTGHKTGHITSHNKGKRLKTSDGHMLIK